MIDVAILSGIRRWHLREGVPIRATARRMGLSGNTVRKYLASDVVEPKYPARKSGSKLHGFEAKLSEWLKTEAGRVRKQRPVMSKQRPLRTKHPNSLVFELARDGRRRQQGIDRRATRALRWCQHGVEHRPHWC